MNHKHLPQTKKDRPLASKECLLHNPIFLVDLGSQSMSHAPLRNNDHLESNLQLHERLDDLDLGQENHPCQGNINYLDRHHETILGNNNALRDRDILGHSSHTFCTLQTHPTRTQHYYCNTPTDSIRLDIRAGRRTATWRDLRGSCGRGRHGRGLRHRACR